MEFLWFLSSLRTPALEKIMQCFTYFGQEAVLIPIIAIYFWCINKRYAYRVGLSFCTSGVLVQGLKIVFCIPRPWILDPQFKPVKSAVGAATGFSFPSGHTQGATSIYGAFFTTVKKGWQKAIFVLLILCVGFSRMFLGVHTPKDVLTSMGLSIIMIILVSKLIVSYEEGKSKLPYALIIIITVGSVLLLVYAGIRYQSGAIELRYVKDCFKAVGASVGFIIGMILEQRYIDFDVKASKKGQVLKVLIGLFGLAILYVGLKKVAGASLILSLLRNFVVVIYMIYLYPLLFTKILNKK